jgi:endonuclease I
MLVKIEKERERDTWKGSWDDDMTEYHFYIFLRFIGKPTRLIKTKYDNRSMEEMWKENEWVSEWERERNKVIRQQKDDVKERISNQ